MQLLGYLCALVALVLAFAAFDEAVRRPRLWRPIAIYSILACAFCASSCAIFAGP